MAQEAYDLAPYSPAAQFEYAVSKMSVGKPEESVPVIKALVERFPNSEKAMELLAQAYNQTGDAEALEATLGDIM
jgi:predicted Zn-dependent protease